MADVVLARSARKALLDLSWPLIDAIEDALGLLAREPICGDKVVCAPTQTATIRVDRDVRDQLARSAEQQGLPPVLPSDSGLDRPTLGQSLTVILGLD